jgi:hypothetical protein
MKWNWEGSNLPMRRKFLANFLGETTKSRYININVPAREYKLWFVFST